MSDACEIFRKDGELVGYSCGSCGRVFRLLEFRALNEGHPADEWYTASQAVEDCCRCSTELCRAPIDRRTQGSHCDACHWYHRWDYVWRSIGYVVRLGVTNEVVWRVVQSELDYGHHMNMLHAFMEGREYEGCHCGHDGGILAP